MDILKIADTKYLSSKSNVWTFLRDSVYLLLLLVYQLMLGGSPREPPTSVTHWIQYIVILMAMIYYSEITLSKISKGKGAWEVHRKPGTCFQEFRSSGVKKVCFIPPAKKGWNIFQGSSLETVCPDVLVGTGSLGTLWLAHTKNSSRKDRFWIKHKFCTNSLGITSHPYQRMVGILLIPSSQTSDKDQSGKQACLRKEFSVLLCKLFSAQSQTSGSWQISCYYWGGGL